MKKIIYNIGIAAILLCGFNGCSEILDTTPYSTVASASMWTTEDLVDQGVAGVYQALQDWAPYSGAFAAKNGSTWAFEPWGMGGQLRYSEAITSGSINPGSGIFSNTWQKLYEGVHRANRAIKYIPETSPASAEKNARLVAEAKFLRAYFYMRLNTLFGRDGLGVPIYTEPIQVKDCTLGQSPEDEVWALIIQDLTDCINEPNLPNKDATGRVSKGAAYALRGKAYLCMGAVYANDGSVKKNASLLQQAVSDFDKVAGCGYGLFQGGYKALFTQANEDCEEMIFSIQHIDLQGYGTLSQKYCGSRYAYAISGGNGWGDLTVSPYVVDLYENADGTPFNWDAVDPSFAGWSTMAPTDRAVFFVRDKQNLDGTTAKDANTGTPMSATLLTRTDAILNAASAAAKAKYLNYGNEARIKKAYANRDPRLAANVITPYAGIVGGYSYSKAGEAMEVFYRWPVQASNQTPEKIQWNDLATDNANDFTYFHRKFVYEGADLPLRDDGPTDEPLIRYADVLLMWAEALVELNDFPGAMQKVKQVRDRAGVNMPTLASSFANETASRNYVRDERRREFLNEGIDFFDEMRWRTWKDSKFKGGENGKTETIWGSTANGGSYKWAGDFLYVWPVPRSETQMIPNLKPTPGWAY